MRLSTPSSFVAVLLILPTSLCHVLDDRLPPLRFFGGRKAVEGLRIYQRNAPVSIDKRWFSDPDVNHHKKCGPGIGSCDAGDWWVQFLSHNKLFSNVFTIVAPQAGIADEGFISAQAPDVR
jgi:hypothetical protein